MENHPVDKIEPGNNSHDDIDYNSTLSGKTKPIKSVVTTPETEINRSKPKETDALQKSLNTN